jgi:putative transcriptional regulator
LGDDLPVNEPQRGRLLIAGPGLGDANFDRTIVYLLEHGIEGSIGVVINRPSQFEVADALPSWAGVVGQPPVVFSGGPVEAGVALGLARACQAREGIGWSSVDGDIGSVDLSQGPEAVTGAIEVARVFVGYSGWGAGQLDHELGAGAWFVVDAEPGDLFTPEPENLWGSVLRREQARSAMAGSNPSWN